MTREQLEAIRARHAAATPGPWRWFGQVGRKPRGQHVELYLATVDRGRVFVMDFIRAGMQGAQPRFQLDCVMVPASKVAEHEVPYRDDITRLAHPDAEAIAHSWEDVHALLAHIDALEKQGQADHRALHDALGWAHDWHGEDLPSPWRAVTTVLAELEQARRERDAARFLAADARVAREQGRRAGLLEAAEEAMAWADPGEADGEGDDSARRLAELSDHLRALSAQPKADTEDKS